MICPYCSQTHPDEIIDCPTTGKKLKRACTYQLCSYYGEYLFPLEQDTCPCCGNSLVDTHNGRQFVDLGLSVKWATCNIGATSPEECGDYFRWGEITPYNLHCTKSDGKYYYRRLSTLEYIDDAARNNWNGRWRMPTRSEFEELINCDNCGTQYSEFRGIAGYTIKSNIPGFKGNSIFLPYNTLYSSEPSRFCYWSSSFDEPESPCGLIDFYRCGLSIGYDSCFNVNPIRAVFD